MMTPRRGLSQVRSGQKGFDGPPLVRFSKIKARERRISIRARLKGRKPGPGCLNLPMEREVELHAVITPMARRMYPETRFHFSMPFLLPNGYFPNITEILKNYPSPEKVVKGNIIGKYHRQRIAKKQRYYRTDAGISETFLGP